MTRTVTTKGRKRAKLIEAERRRIELDNVLDAAMREAAGERCRHHRINGQRRKIEIYSAGCPVCRKVEAMIRRIVGANHDVEVLDMHQDHVARQAARRGIRRLPGVVVDGHHVACCIDRGVDEAILRSAIAAGG